MKKSCPRCLTVEITRLRKERDYYKMHCVNDTYDTSRLWEGEMIE